MRGTEHFSYSACLKHSVMKTLTFPSYSCPSTFHTPQIPKNSQSIATLLLSIPHFRTRLSFKMWVPRHSHNKTKKVPGEKAKHETRLCTKSFAYLHLPQSRTELFLSSGLESLRNGDCISPKEHLPKLPCLGFQDRFTELGQAPHDHDGITRHDWCLSVLEDRNGKRETRCQEQVCNRFHVP